ncbi:MAG: efflux RND transporter periplasmic adaptor subunit, partial [Mariprofundaceae bacterium]|nr:efflux RND transporter periplasmic adaptor subunit [Mariprofundaceae bacterium]
VDGQHVEKGELLVALQSSPLDHRLTMLNKRMNLLQWQASAQGVSDDVAAESRILREQMVGELAELESLKERIGRLKMIAPFAGEVVMVNLDARQGDYVQKSERLLTVVDSAQPVVRAYVFERDLKRFESGAEARFYPEDPALEPLDVKVSLIDRASAKVLLDPPLGSVFGGTIPVIAGQDGVLIPQQAVYRVMLRPVEGSRLNRSVRGKVYVEGSRRSLLARFFDQVMAVLVRESGF